MNVKVRNKSNGRTRSVHPKLAEFLTSGGKYEYVVATARPARAPRQRRTRAQAAEDEVARADAEQPRRRRYSRRDMTAEE